MRRRVLIVDDHAIVRRLVRSLFEAQDLDVSDASDGAEGVQRAQEVNPGLIILDLSMPVMNGLDAARALTKLMPEVPLLMFTNNVGAFMQAEARSAGICSVICKSDANSSDQLLAQGMAVLNRQDNRRSSSGDVALS